MQAHYSSTGPEVGPGSCILDKYPSDSPIIYSSETSLMHQKSQLIVKKFLKFIVVY